ncbi:allatostatin [Maniola hyperantus]|uniref:allatostatin n=1 Tax=Aphantopus hyperantus TaxID=2795564 RepID=UPI001569430D|nr:allatostatin [Maniola hyperantus]
MNSSTYNTSIVIFFGTLAMLMMTATAAPMEPDEQSENTLVGRPEDAADLSAPWEALNTAALRKLLLQLDADDRFAMAPRVGRSWPQTESRGWGLRAMDGRLARQWRADKRQVRFRQCYFNPISCFRK